MCVIGDNLSHVGIVHYNRYDLILETPDPEFFSDISFTEGVFKGKVKFVSLNKKKDIHEFSCKLVEKRKNL